MTDFTNITASGPNSIAANGDVFQETHHHHAQPQKDPLTAALEQRDQAYYSWQDFDKKRRAALRSRWFNIWNAGALLSGSALAAAIFFIVWPGLIRYVLVYWLTHQDHLINNLTTFSGALVLIPFISLSLCSWRFGIRRQVALADAIYFASHARAMADECHRLDAQIKYFKKHGSL